jgi:FixJ family two-component response regulator
LRKVVAIVDQDPRTRREIARLVSAFGFTAETFDAVAAFLKSTAASRAACLVIDLALAGGSGMELALQLAGAGCKCPIVFTTALDDERSRREAAAAGGVACLRKPIRADLLVEIIIKAIG